MDTKANEHSHAIVPVLACVLDQLCQRNDKLPLSHKTITKFHALRPPTISIKDYLQRVAKYANCSSECFVLALIYIDRIIQSHQNFVVNSFNIHRLLITSVMLAAKFFDDHYYNNAYYAKVGGVPSPEMNLLEVEFLFMTNFTLFVTTDTYKQYYTELCNHARNGMCSCSNQRVPSLYIPADKTGELSYRYEDTESDTEELEDEAPQQGTQGQQLQQGHNRQQGSSDVKDAPIQQQQQQQQHQVVNFHTSAPMDSSKAGQFTGGDLSGAAMMSDSPAVPPRRIPGSNGSGNREQNQNQGQGPMQTPASGQEQMQLSGLVVSPTYQMDTKSQNQNMNMKPGPAQQSQLSMHLQMQQGSASNSSSFAGSQSSYGGHGGHGIGMGVAAQGPYSQHINSSWHIQQVGISVPSGMHPFQPQGQPQGQGQGLGQHQAFQNPFAQGGFAAPQGTGSGRNIPAKAKARTGSGDRSGMITGSPPVDVRS